MMHDLGHKRNQTELFYHELSADGAIQKRLLQRYGERKTPFDLRRGVGRIPKQHGMQS